MPGTDISKLVSIFEDITAKLAESQEPNRLYDVAVQIAMETTDAQACSLYLEQSVMDATKLPDHITMVAGAGFEKYRIGVAKYAKGEGLTGRMWETSKPVKFDTQAQVEDPKNGWRGLHNKVVLENVANWVSYSLIGVPLRIGDRTIGVLKVENKNPGSPCRFSDDDQVLLETIASTIALAIENQRYSEQSYSSILNALREVSEMLVGAETMTFQTLCDSIVEKCIQVFNAEACSLYIEDVQVPGEEPEHIVMMSGAGYENNRIGVKYKKGEGLTGSIWKNSLPVKYDTRAEVEDPNHGWKGLHNEQVRAKDTNWECCSLIGVPLRIGDRTIGVLKVENKKPVKQSHFTHNELRSLEILASNIALALEMRRQREVVFKKGERARQFTHRLGNSVQTALSCTNDALSHMRSLGKSDSMSMEEVVDYLEIAQKTLLTIDDLRKAVLDDRSAEQVRATLPLNQILRRVIDRCQPVLQRKNVELSQRLLAKDAFTNVNLEEVLEAFDNLIGNTVDAVGGLASPKMWIEANFVGGTGSVLNMATVLLVDNGPGFTEEQRKEFEKTGSISSSKHTGLGMGVAIASRFLADNSIYLKIVDPPSRLTRAGAAFQMDIPVVEPRSLKVLVIDDEDTVLDLLKLHARSSGNVRIETRMTYDILQEAINGSQSALAALSDFDFILVDCSFLDFPLDGPMLLKRLQDTNKELANHVVLMSGKIEYKSRTDVTVLDKYEDIINHFPEGLYELRKRKG
jgi:transcriptional regulator with GAF, ATPase, and Fis domain/CheY-like chemotaxis protein